MNEEEENPKCPEPVDMGDHADTLYEVCNLFYDFARDHGWRCWNAAIEAALERCGDSVIEGNIRELLINLDDPYQIPESDSAPSPVSAPPKDADD